MRKLEPAIRTRFFSCKEQSMSARAFVRTLVLGSMAVMSFAFGSNAEAAWPRYHLIEQFTSATCGPCVAAGPVMERVVNVQERVLSIRYHLNFPAPGDPWYVANSSQNGARQNLYGVSSIPTARFNGPVAVDPRDEQALRARITAGGTESPLLVTVSETGTANRAVQVKVRSDQDLTGHRLHVVVVSRKTTLPNLPNELQYSNGETEFSDAMLRMLPSQDGTTFDITQGEEKTFDLTYTVGTGALWPTGQQYVIAFVQTPTGEILQAGTNLEEVRLEMAINGTIWDRIDQGATKTGTVTVTNPSSKAVTARVFISNNADLQTAGWTASLNPAQVPLAAGASATINYSVQAPNAVGFAPITIVAEPIVTPSPGVVAINTTGQWGYLTNGARVISWLGSANGAGVTLSDALNAQTHSSYTTALPLADPIIAAYNPADFDVNVFDVDFINRGYGMILGPIVRSLEASSKSVWFQSSLDRAIAYNPQYASISGDFRAWVEALGMVQPVQEDLISRSVQSGNVIQLQTFRVTGVQNDVVGGGLSATLNEYNSASWPFYTQASEVIGLSTSSQATVIANYDGNKAAGIRVVGPNGGKVVYQTWNQELIGPSGQTARRNYGNKALTWLLAADNANGPAITLNRSSVNFGSITVNTTKDETITITNSGKAPLIISAIDLAGTDATAFDITAGQPGSGQTITVAPNGTHTFTVRYAPTEVKQLHTARVVLASNASTNPSITLNGAASGTSSVETETASATGAIAMRLTGSNPVVGNSTIDITAVDNINVTVVDNMGRTVATIFNGSVNGTERVVVNAADLAAGMYTIVASNGAERAALTVVVSR
ncbi:MAG TPA: hypothetical protein DIS79_05380 [Bacteroidetes bacterium]|nr:hypothetical protein [Bacteroidota bacterium]HRK04143.1 choice-of-anchor D domain-containing protein [Chlorobiota bacterium]